MQFDNIVTTMQQQGSKDNMTAMVVILDDGTNYDQPAMEFVPVALQLGASTQTQVCCGGVTVVYSGATILLQWCHSGVAVV
jgi:hypothetical protein